MSKTKNKGNGTESESGKNQEHEAVARALNLPISTKHSVEISKFLRYKTTEFAKEYLEEVTVLKKAIPFKSHVHDMGHKRGMASGRYPQKAAKEFLKLIKSVEANAQFKGLNTSLLKIITLIANQASIPFTGGRHRRATKRTHLEIRVREARKKVKNKTENKHNKLNKERGDNINNTSNNPNTKKDNAQVSR